MIVEITEPIRLSKNQTNNDNFGHDLTIVKITAKTLKFPFKGIDQCSIKIVDTATGKEINIQDLNKFEIINIIDSLNSEYKFLTKRSL